MTETPEAPVEKPAPTAKKKATPPPPPPDEGLNKVLVKAPKHAGCKIKIHKLWDKHYRVNYHEIGPEAKIIYSYFAELLEESKIQFTWDEQVSEFERVTRVEIK